jgi:hypothetical protein
VAEQETLTAERALTLLREVVAERPDYVYQSPVEDACVYIDPTDRRPSCLAGHVFIRAGWDLDELERANQVDVLSFVGNHTARAVDPNAASVLQEAQDWQDGGATWAKALTHAERVAAELGVLTDGGDR